MGERVPATRYPGVPVRPDGSLAADVDARRVVREKVVDLWRLEGRRIIEARAQFDRSGMLQPLGLLGTLEEQALRAP